MKRRTWNMWVVLRDEKLFDICCYKKTALNRIEDARKLFHKNIRIKKVL